MDFYFHDIDSLLDRLEHGYKTGEEFVFLIGSGVTCPVGGMAGVLGVSAVIDLIRKEFSNTASNQVIEQAGAAKGRNPKAEYQNAFQSLNGRRGPDFVNRIIRQAVLSARVPDAQHSLETQRLSTEAHIRPDECQSLCALLEKDIEHWHIRPGLSSLGKILTEFQSSFGNVLLTTNFDPLIKVSVRLAGGATETWMLDGDGPRSWPSADSAACRILHLHGSWAGDTLHTKIVIEDARPNLEYELAKILRKRVLVVVGYGGWDDVFTKAFSQVSRDPDAQLNVLWTFFSSSAQEIIDNDQELLHRLRRGHGGNRVVFHNGVDADIFFPALLDRLREARQAQSKIGSVQAVNIPGNTPPSLAAAVNDHLSPPEPVPAAPVQQASKAASDHSDFLSLLQQRCHSVIQVDEIPANEREFIQEPNFLLFEREGKVVMTIAPSSESIDPHRLQKTTEPQVKCQPLPLERVEALGFTGGNVHPMFKDKGREIQRIYWDASLLVQTILFPDSKVALPVYDVFLGRRLDRKLLVPIHTVLEHLVEWHGQDKIIFANIVARRPTRVDNPVFEKLIAGYPFITRFAPTPSSQLHLGNVRTALATYLLSLRDKDRSRFYIRIDNTDHTRCPKYIVDRIKEELRWLGIRWDARNSFEQDAADASDIYESLLKVLELAELTETGKEGTVTLKTLPVKQYYCVYYDRREGAIVTHQPPLTKRGSVFSRADLKDPVGLVAKLCDSRSPFSQYLWERFSAQGRSRLEAWTEPSSADKSFRDTLVEELNRLLAGPCLYEKERFSQVKLTNKTRGLVEDNLRGEDRGLLNRLLLEEAYPHELGRRPTRKKKVDLSRGNNLNAFYRFAGLIDDIRCLTDKEHLTCVLRDNRQAELTHVQAHIRFALELARQKLASNEEAQQLFRASGLNPQKSIPLPLYFHLPVVTDNGKTVPPIMKEDGKVVPQYTVLRKRQVGETEALNKYTLNYLRHQQHVLPESIVAYLISTIIPRRTVNLSWKKHLTDVAYIFSQLEVHAGLQFFSQSFGLDDLVRKQKPVHCDLRDLQFVEQVIVRKLPVWRLDRKLRNAPEKFSGDGAGLISDQFIGRIAENAAEFANYSQILSVIKWPKNKHPLSAVTIRLLEEVSMEFKGDVVMERIKLEIDRMRGEISSLSGTHREQRKFELSQLLGDLRLVLTGAESSPKIGPLMTMLGDEEAVARIRRYLVGGLYE